MPTVYIVHGYNVRDPRHLFRARTFFESYGLPVIPVDYGWTGIVLGLLRVRFITPKEAGRLVRVVNPGDIGIGHSNGCNVLHQASEKGAPFSRLIYVNAALKSDLCPDNEDLERVFSLSTPDDRAVLAGEILRWISPLRLVGLHTKWGAMGRWGYTGEDPRVRTVWLHRALGLSPDAYVGHGGAYRWDRLRRFGQILVRLSLGNLKAIDEDGGLWGDIDQPPE